MLTVPVRVANYRGQRPAPAFVMIAAALGIAMPTAAAFAGDAGGAPERQSGWWEFSATSDAGKAMGTQYLCVGSRSEVAFSAFDQLAEGTCTRRTFTPALSGWTFDYACDDGAGVSIGKGTISGDFATAYQVTQSVEMGGVTTRGTIAATRKGACPASRTEGDFVVSPHVIINILE